jgi:DNA-binding transcriptional ArsR family regulator
MGWEPMVKRQDAQRIDRAAETQAKYCRVFSNARRIQILWALAEGELSVGAIAEAVGTSLQNISQHLSVMKVNNLVTSRREGKTVYYRTEKAVLMEHCLGLLRMGNPGFQIKSYDK